MTERQYGRICNITSVTGPLVSMAGTSAYSAAKGGMDGMMRAVAIECGGDGITINGVAPGLIDTGALGPAMLTAGEYNPIGRPGTSDEIAAAAEFLCTPDSAYITGQVRCAPPAAAAGPVVAHTLSPARCRTRSRL
jgi:3-oxoacyl-[acyl-carrier protein] reductase